MDVNQDSGENEINPPLINSDIQNINEPVIVQQIFLEKLPSDESNSNRKNLKDQISQRARTVLNKSPSLTSVFTNTSSTPETIYWIELYIERGKDLSIKDFNGTSDPYVKVYYGTEEKYTTNTAYKNLNPIWNEKCSFFVYDLNLPISFYLFDYDRIGRDEPMGSTKIDLWKYPLEKLSNITLDLDNEKRTDGKIGILKINLTITSKTSEFRDEVKLFQKEFLINKFLIKIMRSLSKPIQRKSSLTGRLSGFLPIRRTIDVFIIEGRNLISSNKVPNPYIRLKLGTNKKNRTQVFEEFKF